MSGSIERSIRTAELSLKMEGFSVTETCKELCRKLLAGEIMLQEYLSQVIPGLEWKNCLIWDTASRRP